MKHITSIFFFLFVFFPSYSQTSVWEIEKDGAKIFIGGTVHILREQDYPLPGQFIDAYNRADILVTELDQKEMYSQPNIIKLQKAMSYSDDKTLKTVLNNDVYNELDSVCKQNGMNLLMMDKFKPSMVILALTFQVLNKLGVKSEGVDMFFANKAASDNKTCMFLETFDEQLNFIENMGKGNENEFVRYSIKDLEVTNSEFGILLDEWKTGKSELSISMLKEFEQNHPEIYKTLLVERNNNWIPLLESYLETPKIELVLFGAMHLYGSSGILQQLQSKGCNIRQL